MSAQLGLRGRKPKGRIGGGTARHLEDGSHDNAGRLNKTDNELRAEFAALTTRADVAFLLGSNDSELIYLLYRGGIQYIEFDVPKRRGGVRRISAPTSSIKILQKRLNQVLQAVYRPKAPVFGFARARSIVANADRHVRKRLILNIDLKDFFPSIDFGRVRGMFRSLGLNDKVAQILAQLCCHQKRLPQGAASSPVVSNMVCGALDTGLRRLAERFGCTYTRYADDITFSTTRRQFPVNLVSFTHIAGGTRQVVLGQDLLTVIQTNSFEVNPQKIRVRTLGERREVTLGIELRFAI